MSDRSVKAIFGEAIEKPPAERAAFLDGACRGDPELREQVDTLLAAWEQADDFLASPTAEEAPPTEVDLEQPGSRIGLYKLLQKIGEGGMGTVYMAEQEEPVRRKVALKIIKLGMDTKQVIARFEAERQALAMMDHPNIAKVLDAGTTSTGRPYFVMELVRGVAIHEFCDTKNVSTDERLRLFIAVCNAVQHAHQKGVIHRDLKPSNVLVTLHDGVPVPKVIDFGIAKATSSRLTDKTLFTEFRSFLGTPEYMSPEQAEMSGLDIDTRSDIYALGVLLYELLTGSTPFDARTLRQAAFDELQRIIREDEPPKPSTRLSTLAGDTLANLARRQDTDAAGLSRNVRGDLDWIVMKALEKDRTRRYETASAMAEDVRRHLANEPVLASPPSLVYKARKFVRRNRVAVVSGGALVALLLCGILGTSLGFLDARRQQEVATQARNEAVTASEEAETARAEAERRAEEARRAREQEAEQRRTAEAARADALAAKELAESEAARSRAVTGFLVDTLALADPGVALAPDLTVQAVLDRAAEQVGTRFSGQPDVEAALRSTLGQAYFSLGELAAAEPQLRRGLELWDAGIEVDDWTLYETMWPMTSAVFALGSSEISSFGARVMQLSWQMLDEHPDLVRGLARMVEGNMNGDPERGRAGWEMAKPIAYEVLRPDDRRWRLVADNLFAAGYAPWYFRGDPTAEIYLREALAIYRRILPETHTQVTMTLDATIDVLHGTQQWAEAEELIHDSIRIQRKQFPEGHPQLARSQAKLAASLTGQGSFEEAEGILLDALEVAEGDGWAMSEVLGATVRLYEAWDREPDAARYRAQLAALLLHSDFVPTLETIEPAFRAEHAPLLGLVDRFRAAGSRLRTGMPEDEVYRDLQRAVDEYLRERRATLDPEDPLAPLLARELVHWTQHWGDSARFRDLRGALFDDARGILEVWIDEFPRDYAFTLRLLASFELQRGGAERAEIMLREALQLARRADERSSLCAEIMVDLATALERQDRPDEAEPFLVGAYPIFSEQLGEQAWDTFACASRIERLFRTLGRPEGARPVVERQVAALKRAAEHPPRDLSDLRDFARFLLECTPEDLRSPGTAIPFLRYAIELTGGTLTDDFDLLVRALVDSGDVPRAADVLRQVLAQIGEDDPWRASFEARLAEYEALGG